MVNKPFWHIGDFVLASYTFGCVKISDFVPNNRHLQEVLIFFFHLKKTAAEAHRELQKFYGDAALSETMCRDWFRRFKDGYFYVDDRRVKEGQKSSKTLMLFIMSCWNWTKPSLGNGIGRNWCDWAAHCAKNGNNTSRGTKKWFCSMTTLGLTLPNPLKPTWKRSNGKSYPTRRILQILCRPIITCSGRYHMVWLISSSAYMKTSKNGLIRG